MAITVRYIKTINKGYSVHLDICHNYRRKRFATGIQVAYDYSKRRKVLPEDKEKLKLLQKLKLEYELKALQGLSGPVMPTNSPTLTSAEPSTTATDVTLYEYAVHIAKIKNNKTYRANVGKLEKHFGRSFLLKELTPNHVRTYYQSLHGYSANTRALIHSVFRCILNNAKADKLISENPVHQLYKQEIPAKVESQRLYLTVEELKKLKATKFTKNPQTADAFWFAVHTGLRIGDILKLKFSDIENKTLQYRQEKSKKKFHYLPLSDQAMAILKRQQHGNTLVFHQVNDGQNEHLKQWAKEAGISKPVTWHIARHTHATLLLNKGVDIFTVSKLLGHSDIKTTQVYAKLNTQSKLEALNKFPKL